MSIKRSYIRAALRSGGVTAKNLKNFLGSNCRIYKTPRVTLKIIITPKNKTEQLLILKNGDKK